MELIETSCFGSWTILGGGFKDRSHLLVRASAERKIQSPPISSHFAMQITIPGIKITKNLLNDLFEVPGCPVTLH